MAKAKRTKDRTKSTAKPNGAGRFQSAIKASTFGPKTKGGKLIDDAVERKRYKDKCPVKIAVEDVQKKADGMAKVVEDREVVLEEKRAANAEYRDKLAYFDERLKELAESVRSHTESRDVDVVEFLIPRTGEIVIIRQDTGEQVGPSRAATAQDRQADLFDGHNPNHTKSTPGDPKAMLRDAGPGDDDDEQEETDRQTFDDLTKGDKPTASV